ncbi:MAG: diacylglycerol/lipid kinase family protein [Acidimicrobiia bacterium]
MTHWTVIVNPAAGRGRTRRLLPKLSAAFDAARADTRIHLSTSRDDGIDAAREAFARGDAVVACGGDGTVSELAAVAVEHHGLLGIVPTGSGNDFARTLGFDHRNPLSAIDVLTTGRDAVVDLGRAATPEQTVLFCAVASTGFDAEANRWANQRRHLHGTPLYVAAMLRTLSTYSPLTFTLRVDDAESVEHRAWLLAFGNSESYGGGMRVTPNARVDDGLLDATIVGPVSRGEFVRTFPKVFKGTHLSHAQISTYRARQFTVDAPDAPVPVELYASGERVGRLPATIDVLAQALTVRVPADSHVPSA